MTWVADHAQMTLKLELGGRVVICGYTKPDKESVVNYASTDHADAFCRLTEFIHDSGIGWK
jgi:hypothetical protein